LIIVFLSLDQNTNWFGV